MKHAPAKKANNQRSVHAVAASHYSGPLPPPEQLAQFDKVLPGSAERIMVMAEKQSHHRRSLERRGQTLDFLVTGAGMIFALFVCLVAIAGGVYCVLKGQPWPGSFLSGTGLAAIVAAFIYGKRN